jgi:Uma2 family endonuclease
MSVMSAVPITKLSEEDNLALERSASIKSEYYRGEMFAIAGTGNNHNIITANVIITIGSFLTGKGCTIYPSDMRLHIPEDSLYTYPDAMVVCGQKQFKDEKKDTILNPVLIVEVLSPTTEAYDRGEKFRLYRSIPNLQEYLLVDSQRFSIEKSQRNEEGNWVLTDTQHTGSSLHLTSIDLQLKLQDVYAGVKDIPA